MISRSKLDEYIVSAIKRKDSARVRTLKMLKETVKSTEDGRPKSQTVTDIELQVIIKNMITQRTKAIEKYKGREDWVHKEKEEIEILISFLPKLKRNKKERSKEEKDKIIRARLRQFHLNPEMKLVRALHYNLLIDNPDITVGDVAKTIQTMISERKKEMDDLQKLVGTSKRKPVLNSSSASTRYFSAGKYLWEHRDFL